MSDRIYFDNVEFTDCYKRKDIRCWYTKVYGPNSGTMLNGDEIEDIVAFKLNYQRPYRPLREARLTELLAALKKDTITVTLEDPITHIDRSFLAKIAEPRPTRRVTDVNGVRWYTLEDLDVKELSEDYL